MMLAFAVVAALLVLIAIATILIPLLRKSDAHGVIERGDANLQVLRDQLAELEGDLRSGVLSPDQYESARADLERRVLDESRQARPASSAAPTASRWRTPTVIGVLLPLCAVLLYLYLGSVDGLDVDAYTQKQAAEITPEHMQGMTRQLVQHLQDNPDDVEGWTMLGRSYMVLQQYPESARAWQRAAELEPENADILANYAEAVALVAQGDLDGEPTRLLTRALELDPSNSKALALRGGAAFARGDYKDAIEYWRRLLLLSGDDNELSAALMTGIAEAQARLDKDTGTAKPTGLIRGVVNLSPQMSAGTRPGDTVFIYARAADGPRMPLAVARVSVDDLPYDFQLDDSMAMTAGRKLSDFKKLVVGARVSASGNATRTSGDLEGFSAPVEPGASGIKVLIDQRVP